MGEVEIVTEKEAALLVPDEVTDMQSREDPVEEERSEPPNPKSDKAILAPLQTFIMPQVRTGNLDNCFHQI